MGEGEFKDECSNGRSSGHFTSGEFRPISPSPAYKNKEKLKLCKLCPICCYNKKDRELPDLRLKRAYLLPAICLISDTVSSLKEKPSNFFIVEKIILEMFRLRPIPIASLATRTLRSLLSSLNIVAWKFTEQVNSLIESLSH
jgi:hypothetical protein